MKRQAVPYVVHRELELGGYRGLAELGQLGELAAEPAVRDLDKLVRVLSPRGIGRHRRDDPRRRLPRDDPHGLPVVGEDEGMGVVTVDETVKRERRAVKVVRGSVAD